MGPLPADNGAGYSLSGIISSAIAASTRALSSLVGHESFSICFSFNFDEVAPLEGSGENFESSEGTKKIAETTSKHKMR